LRIIDVKQKVKFLFVGRLVVNKGLIELITALSTFNEYNWHLNIVGDGEYRDSIVALIAKLNLGAKITLIGSIPFGSELIETYRKHDVVILPSYCEGLPQVILEGMANGCLVMATSVGGVPQVISHLHNGLLFEPQSSDAISEVLSLLTTTNSLELKSNALNTAFEYAQENQIENFFNVLK
jgi:glycosyltransferase involved in cell wall biosynthesis